MVVYKVFGNNQQMKRYIYKNNYQTIRGPIAKSKIFGKVMILLWETSCKDMEQEYADNFRIFQIIQDEIDETHLFTANIARCHHQRDMKPSMKRLPDYGPN